MEMKKKSQWSWKQFIICFVVSMGTMGFSYPASIIGTTLAQPSFLVYMSLLTPEGAFTDQGNSLIGAMSGVFQAGGVFGILGVTIVMDKWGRKAGMWFCATLGLVGGALTCAAQGVAMFIAVRFLSGAGAWGFLSITPVYTAEIAPPALRGLFVGMNGIGIALGYAIATYIGLGFFYSSNPQLQWRGSYGIALIFSLLPLVAMFFVPESPRWLLMVNRVDDAKKTVRQLHNLDNEEEQHFAMAEFYQMQKQIEYDRTVEPSWIKMFTRKSYRARLVMTCTYSFLAQATGILVINNYGPILYATLGFDGEKQLIYACGWITMGIGGNLMGALIIDKIGRKPLMLIGIGGCLLFLTLEAAMVASFASPVSDPPNRRGIEAAIAFLYLFVFTFGMGVDVSGFVFYGEIFPNHIRSKGMAITVTTFCLSSLIWLQVAPTAFANIGWKFYLVFICILAVGLVFISLILPETKGIPLEEIAVIFGDQDEVVIFSEDLAVGDSPEDLVVRNHAAGEGENDTAEKASELHHETVRL
ncbi:hypothetical protein B0A52_10328 [Exophiala mesophila]|uniref:Major facilitator superfamily (MFS) profile domain-containing protein n=1 Tax=Exophiala mesophila TaxID=212818 RepID=A0A438MRR3_EXOME|nr:hypothetical protein B0A52_10328 [Exophiala mesophila]